MDKSNFIGFVIREDNGSNNSLFLSCQMGLSDGASFTIKHTPLPNGNRPISSPVYPMGVADTLEHCLSQFSLVTGFFVGTRENILHISLSAFFKYPGIE